MGIGQTMGAADTAFSVAGSSLELQAADKLIHHKKARKKRKHVKAYA